MGTNGNLGLRNDVAATTVTSSTPVPPGTWREVEVVLNVNGASGTVQVLLDGVQVNALTTTMNFGTTPIGRLMIGDNTAGRTFQVAFDEVVAFVTSGDTQDPTAPSKLQASRSLPIKSISPGPAPRTTSGSRPTRSSVTGRRSNGCREADDVQRHHRLPGTPTRIRSSLTMQPGTNRPEAMC